MQSRKVYRGCSATHSSLLFGGNISQIWEICKISKSPKTLTRSKMESTEMIFGFLSILKSAYPSLCNYCELRVNRDQAPRECTNVFAVVIDCTLQSVLSHCLRRRGVCFCFTTRQSVASLVCHGLVLPEDRITCSPPPVTLSSYP